MTNGEKAEGVTSARDALRLVWEADSYPILGNEDLPVFTELMNAAMEKIATAVPAQDDPPEFASWLTVLRQADASSEARDDVIGAIHDFFREASSVDQ